MATALKIALTKMRCLEETNEVGSDEPYVLVFAAHLKPVIGGITIPSANTTMYGPWSEADEGDLLTTGKLNFQTGKFEPPANCWGLDGKPAAITNPNEVIILVALMENDDATASGIRAGLHAQMFAALTSYSNSNMSRATIVQKLKKDMRDVLVGITVTGIPNSDDLVGIAELPVTTGQINEASAGNTVVTNITLKGDGGEYRLRFEMSRG